MNSKNKLRQHAKAMKDGGRVFMTADEVMSHFLPNRGAERRTPSGKELGAQAAERAFAGLPRGKRAPEMVQKL